MKKALLLILLSFTTQFLSAKHVKFAVDMSGNTINTTGIHVTGDFQTIAGFPGGDFMPNTTTLTQEVADTNIYSIVVDIPAFAKYEYKFVNGDQFYEAEFVPVESRVGYNFNDNRWIFVDSLADDTTFVGAIRFAQNAPAGLTLLRFLVDMTDAPSISADGIHVAGTHQGFDPATTRLYSFGANVFEIINYVTTGSYEYKYYNGNAAGTEELIPTACAVNSNRAIAVAIDTVLPAVCFGGCSACSATGISESKNNSTLSLFPNPTGNSATISFNDNETIHQVYITDLNGRLLKSVHCATEKMIIEKGNFIPGTYLVTSVNSQNRTATSKLFFE